MTETSLSLRLKDHRPEPVEGALPDIDKWLAASGLQKAIRRGKQGEALTCTRILVDVDPQRLWRRVAVIAMEDVGVADMAAVADTILASRSKVWRDENGGDWLTASFVVSNLAAAVKCRGADDLGLVAVFDPDYKEARAELACATDATLCDVVADATQPLTCRSLAALYLSGTNRWSAPALPRRRGQLSILLEVFSHIGVPEYVIETIRGGAAKEAGALPCNLGLLWLQVTNSPTQTIRDERDGLTHLGTINGLSSEAFDVHTRLGKRALAYFAKACAPVREFVARHVPERDVNTVIAMLVWHAETSLVDRRLIYDGSEAIIEMAKVAHVASGAFPGERVDEAIDLMRLHLPDLHRARLRVTESSDVA